MANPIFDYYQYAQQQAATFSDTLGVARQVIQHRQRNKQIQQETASMMAEQMHERTMAAEEFERDMVKESYRQEQMNQRHRDMIGVQHGHLQLAQTGAERDASQWQFEVQQENAKMERESYESVIDSFFKDNEHAFSSMGVSRPVVKTIPTYDEETSDFQGWVNQVHVRDDRHPQRNLVFSGPGDLQSYYQNEIQARNKIKPFTDRPDLLKSEQQMSEIERRESISREEFMNASRNIDNPFASEETRRASMEKLLTYPLAVKGDADDLGGPGGRPREAVLKARDSVNQVISEVETFSTQMEEHGIERRHLSPLRLFMDPELHDVDVQGVPVRHMLQTLDKGAAHTWRGLRDSWATGREMPFTQQELDRFYENARGLIEEGTLVTYNQDPIDFDTYGFYRSIETGKIEFGELPQDVIDDFQEKVNRRQNRTTPGEDFARGLGQGAFVQPEAREIERQENQRQQRSKQARQEVLMRNEDSISNIIQQGN